MNENIESINELLNKGISPPPINAAHFLGNFNELSSYIYQARYMKIHVTIFNTSCLSQAQREELKWAGKVYVTLTQ